MNWHFIFALCLTVDLRCSALAEAFCPPQTLAVLFFAGAYQLRTSEWTKLYYTVDRWWPFLVMASFGRLF